MANALTIVESIQSNIGSSIVGKPTTSVEVLPPEQRQVSSVLFEIRDISFQSLNILSGIYDTLIGSFKFDVETQRREQEQATELEKEKKQNTASGTVVSGQQTPFEKGSDFLSSILGGVTGAFTGAAVLSFTKLFLGRLLKAGFFSLVAEKAGDFIAEKTGDEDIGKYLDSVILPATIGGLLFGKKGALVGLALGSLGRVVDYISGKSDEISGYDFASLGISTVMTGLMFRGFGLKTGFRFLTRYGVARTVGAAFGGVPFAVAGLVALALGTGISFINRKKDEYMKNLEDDLNNKAKEIEETGGYMKTISEADQSFIEKSNFLDRYVSGVFGSETNITDQILSSTLAARKSYDELGLMDPATVNTFSNIVDDFSKNLQGAVNGDVKSQAYVKAILSDPAQTNDFLDIITQLRGLAAQGAFGDESTIMLEKILTMSDSLQSIVRGFRQQGDEAILGNPYLNEVAIQKLDVLESIPEKLGKYGEAKTRVEMLTTQIADARSKGEDTSSLEAQLVNAQNQLELSEKQDLKVGSVSIDELKVILGDKFEYLLERSLENKKMKTVQIGNYSGYGMNTGNTTIIQDNSNKDMSQNTSMSGQQIGSMILSAIDADVREDY